MRALIVVAVVALYVLVGCALPMIHVLVTRDWLLLRDEHWLAPMLLSGGACGFLGLGSALLATA